MELESRRLPTNLWAVIAGPGIISRYFFEDGRGRTVSVNLCGYFR